MNLDNVQIHNRINSREVGQTVHNGLHFIDFYTKILGQWIKTNEAQVFFFSISYKKKVEKKNLLMILPQVHLRKPCYDFCFL